MSTDERNRHVFHGRLEDVLGPEEAATLMAHLPPVGWADVATKRDVDGIRRDLGEMRTDLREIHNDAATHMRSFELATTASVLTTASLAFAAARLG